MIENFRELWERSSSAARLGLSLGALLIVAALVYVGSVLLRVDYQTLFADLDPQDAAAMVAELEKSKVPYRLGAGGTAIQVDKSQVHALRLKLLGQGGTLRGGVGFEIFNNTDFGMTEFAQKINYQRALQGELARTIQALDEVKAVRVHLVLPEAGLFKKSGPKPKASITLAMKDGRTLAPEQVRGIQRLVAAAVPDIEPAAVTIADQRGVTLTRQSGVEGDQGIAGRLGIKSDVEAYLTRKLVALFDKSFGPGRVIVSVDVTIDHDQVKVTREDVLPVATRGGTAVGIVTRSRTTVAGDSGNRSGSGGAAQAPASGASTSEIEYANSRRVEQVVSIPGGIKRLSVGVVLPNVMDKSRIDKVRELVATTVGIDASRGDEIAIAALDLSSTVPPAAAAVAAATSAPRPAADSQGAASPSAPAAVVAPAASDGAAGLANSGSLGVSSVLAAMSPGEMIRAAGDAFSRFERIEWLLVALTVAMLVVSATLLASRRARDARRLTHEARADVLKKVQTWMRSDDPLPDSGKRV